MFKVKQWVILIGIVFISGFALLICSMNTLFVELLRKDYIAAIFLSSVAGAMLSPFYSQCFILMTQCLQKKTRN